jgi:hypothetical protein
MADDAIELRVGDRLFTRYHHGAGMARPYFAPLLDGSGRRVTREAGAGADHPHHRGVWFGHRDVGGTDHWTELPGHGRMVHRGFDGVDRTGLRERLDWLGADGEPMLGETRAVRVHPAGESALALDVELRLRAADAAVTLGQTKDAGFAVRLAPWLRADTGGQLQSSEGSEGEGQCWGRRARWCDASGPVDGSIVGVALLDHPANPGHPTTWHVRDYGLVAANPFLARSIEVGAGEELAFRYRLLVHAGDAAAAGMEDRYREFAG